MFPNSKKAKARAEQQQRHIEHAEAQQRVDELLSRAWKGDMEAIDELKMTPSWLAQRNKSMRQLNSALQAINGSVRHAQSLRVAVEQSNWALAITDFGVLSHTRQLLDNSIVYGIDGRKLLSLMLPEASIIPLETLQTAVDSRLAELSELAIGSAGPPSKKAYLEMCRLHAAISDVQKGPKGYVLRPNSKAWFQIVALHVETPHWSLFNSSCSPDSAETRTWAATAFQQRDMTAAKMVLAYLDQNQCKREYVGTYLTAQLAIMIQELKAGLPQPV